jgi:hypothetical protein
MAGFGGYGGGDGARRGTKILIGGFDKVSGGVVSFVY